MPTTPDTRWIPIAEVRPGDLVRVPGGSSFARWACRAQAERADDQPFREVVRLIVGWEGTSRTRLVFRDGFACQMVPDQRVLRLRRI
jgi:hypothetical protein